MVGRIREIVFEDGVDVDGIATGAASEDYVDDKFTTQGDLIVDPHGFTEYDNTYMTRGWVGNVFTLTQVGVSTPYFCKGELKYLTGNRSITVSPTAGPHYIGLNCSTEVLEDLGSSFPFDSVLSTHIICEFFYADGVNVVYKANERHTTKFPKRVWQFNHLYLSTQYRSGITPSIKTIDGNGSDIAHAQWSVTAGLIADEDIEIATASIAFNVSKSLWFYNGIIWVGIADNHGAGVLTGGNGRACYNNIATGLVECTNNYHVLTHLFAANDGTVIGIIGNAQYQRLADAKIAASTEIGTLLNTGLPFPEFRAIATFINKTSNTYSNAVKTAILSVDTDVSFIDWRKTSLNPAAGANAVNHNQLASLQGGQAGEYFHVTSAQNENIVNNVFPTGTPTNTANKIFLPTNTTAGWGSLTPSESLIGWDSTKKKPVVGTGTAIIPIGGGLTPVSLSIGDFTDIGGSISEYQAESGKLYLVDLTGQGATTKYKVVAPDGAAEVVYAVQCKANTNTSYLLGMKGYGGTDKFYYDGAEQTALDFAYPEMRVDFAWDSNDSHFLCAVYQTPLSGNFSGSLDFSGIVKTDTIQEHTSGAGVTVDSVLLKDGGVRASADLRIDSLALADGTSAACVVYGKKSGGSLRYGGIGVLKHAGITEACAYLDMSQQSGTEQFLWVDDSGQFRISSTSTHIGTTNGAIVGTQTSDARLKKVIGPIKYGVNEILKLNPIAFILGDIKRIGFIAQEAINYIPESVYDSKIKIDSTPNTRLFMDYSQIIPVLVKAIQEQQAQIDELKKDKKPKG
jgi:hypothetical protein